MIDGVFSVEEFTAVEAVAKYVWLSRHCDAKDVVSSMRGLADQLEGIDAEKAVDLLKAAAEALTDILRVDDEASGVQAELILQRVEEFLRGEV